MIQLLVLLVSRFIVLTFFKNKINEKEKSQKKQTLQFFQIQRKNNKLASSL